VGYRQIGITVDISNLKQDGVSLANSAALSLGTFYTALGIGYDWKVSEGFGLAFDLGYQFALLHTGAIQINSIEDDGTDNSVDDAREMKRISGLPVPQIAVLRAIWYL
jgi:hypothetical protein